MSMMEIINKLEKRLEERKPETLTVPQAHIIDADGGEGWADVVTKFNTLLAELEAAGILSTS